MSKPSLPRQDDGDEFSALFDYLRRHPLTPDDRDRLRQTSNQLRRDEFIRQLAKHASEWFRLRVRDAVRRELGRQLRERELEQIGRWP